MLFQLHVQKITNQIRKRQRNEMIKQIRNKIYNRHTLSDTQQANKIWQTFLKQPSSKIPWQVVQHFHYLPFDHQELPKIINSILNPEYLINVIFVSQCALIYNMKSTQFFKKSLFVSQSKQSRQFQQIKYLTHLKHPQQIYIEFFINYLETLSQKQTIEVEYVLELQKFYIYYWDKYVDDKRLDYKLCASMIGKLFAFHQHIKKLSLLVKAMLSVLIQQDTSAQTYWLVCVTFRHNPDIAAHLLFDPRFPSFIYSGIKQQTIHDTLRIVQTVVETNSYFEKLNINYLTFLKKMYKLFMNTTNYKIQKDLLFGFYNLTFLQAQEAQQFYRAIDYDQMFEKCNCANLLDFLDFCISVMFNYPSQEIFQHILLGNSLRLIDELCKENNFGQKNWKLANELYQVLQQGVKKRLLIQVIGVKAEQIIKKLEHLDWNDCKLSKIPNKEKELIINKYCALIEECV